MDFGLTRVVPSFFLTLSLFFAPSYREPGTGYRLTCDQASLYFRCGKVPQKKLGTPDRRLATAVKVGLAGILHCF